MFGLFRKKKQNSVNLQDSATLNSWLREEDFDVDDIVYSVVSDQNVLRVDGQLLVVGFGKPDGVAQGSYVEFGADSILDGRTIHSSAVSYWKSLAREASYSGTSLAYKLTEKSVKIAAGI